MLMKTDELGIPRFSNRDLIDMIYSGHADKVHVVLCDSSDDVDKFNSVMEEQGMSPLQKYIPLDVDQKTFDGVCQSEWFMPQEYKELAIGEWLFAKVMEEKIQPDRKSICILGTLLGALLGIFIVLIREFLITKNSYKE